MSDLLEELFADASQLTEKSPPEMQVAVSGGGDIARKHGGTEARKHGGTDGWLIRASSAGLSTTEMTGSSAAQLVH